jgi:repressor LexA
MSYTKRQHALLKFIVEYQRSHEGLSPTLGEMAEHMGVSKVTVFEHLATLKAKGAISAERRKSRSVKVLDTTFGQVAGQIPLRGRIAAGTAIEVNPDSQTFNVDEMLPMGEGHYVLEVRGDSMIEEGIHDGDFVFVRDTTVANNGDVVVAVIGHEGQDESCTLKSFYRHADHIELRPANERLESIRVPQCEVRGIVVGVYRKY